MENFGPLRLYWEGSYCGEKIIQDLKPNIYRIINNWQSNALERFYISKAFDHLEAINCFRENNNSKCNMKTSFKIYGDYEVIVEEFNTGQPLSVTYHSSEKFILMINGEIGIEIKKKMTNPKNVMNLSYFEWELTKFENKIECKSFEINEECLFLPILDRFGICNNHDNSCFYAVVTSNWKELLPKSNDVDEF